MNTVVLTKSYQYPRDSVFTVFCLTNNTWHVMSWTLLVLGVLCLILRRRNIYKVVVLMWFLFLPTGAPEREQRSPGADWVSTTPEREPSGPDIFTGKGGIPSVNLRFSCGVINKYRNMLITVLISVQVGISLEYGIRQKIVLSSHWGLKLHIS